MRNPHDIIRRPIITEASMDGVMERKYTFAVDKTATKTEIKNALEKIFDIRIDKVNTMNVTGKMKRMGAHSGKRPDWKKAIVTLTEESKTIEFFDGMQ